MWLAALNISTLGHQIWDISYQFLETRCIQEVKSWVCQKGRHSKSFWKGRLVYFRSGAERVILKKSYVNSFINEVHSSGLKKTSAPRKWSQHAGHVLPRAHLFWVHISRLNTLGYYLFSETILQSAFLKPASLAFSGWHSTVWDIMSDYISQASLGCVSNDCQRDWCNCMWHTITRVLHPCHMRWIWGKGEQEKGKSNTKKTMKFKKKKNLLLYSLSKPKLTEKLSLH